MNRYVVESPCVGHAAVQRDETAECLYIIKNSEFKELRVSRFKIQDSRFRRKSKANTHKSTVLHPWLHHPIRVRVRVRVRAPFFIHGCTIGFDVTTDIGALIVCCFVTGQLEVGRSAVDRAVGRMPVKQIQDIQGLKIEFTN